MKFCTLVPRTCMHKHLVSDFHFFTKNGSQGYEFQTVQKIEPINIINLPNLQFFLKKIGHIKHAQAYKEHR